MDVFFKIIKVALDYSISILNLFLKRLNLIFYPQLMTSIQTVGEQADSRTAPAVSPT